MFHVLPVRLLVMGMLVTLSPAATKAHTERQIEIKVINERDEPLAEATVMVRPITERSLGDEQDLVDAPSAAPYVLGTTDAEGKVTIDVSQLSTDEPDGPMAVTVVKLGYGMQSLTAQKKAELKCWPLRKREIQIVDEQGLPLPGLRIEQSTPTGLEDPKMRWWTEAAAVTNEFGVATLESHASGQLSLKITTPDGTMHRASVRELNRFMGRVPDLRNMTTLRLARHGQVTGKMAPEFVKDFGLRLIKDYPSSGVLLAGDMTSLDSQPQIAEDGSFHFAAVAEGLNWVVVYRRTPRDPASGETPSRQPVAVHSVLVEAGKTVNVPIESAPLTKVSGRVACSDSATDFTDVQLMISQLIASDARSIQQHAIDRIQCNADGTFVCWLPVGRYQLASAVPNKWRNAAALEFEVGSGAATMATSDLNLSRVKQAKVKWQHEYRMPNAMFSMLSNHLLFRSKERQVGECMLTVDGYGIAYLTGDEPVTSINRDVMGASPQTASAFTDNDPSDNFDLKLVETAQGTSTNIALRGRVVDGEGKGLGSVPVTISLTFALVRSAGPVTAVPPGAVPAGVLPIAPIQAGSMLAGSIQTGSQLLDVVMTELDGSFHIPPRQLLSRLTIPGPDKSAESKFTFTISAMANPQPIEVQKVIAVKPEEWAATHIDFPDLVIDRPLGGQRLTGKFIDAAGRPSAGELVRLADKRHIVRTLSDRDGNFSIDDVAGTTWLMRESDWSIRSVSQYAQAIVCNFVEKSSAIAASDKPWQRLEREQRLKLAKELIQAVPAPNNQLMIAQLRGAPSAEEFYLEPDKFLEKLLELRGVNADALRLQFISFWTNLSQEKLQQLAEAMSQNNLRVQAWLMLADRYPSLATYEYIMKAIEYPEATDRASLQGDQVFELLANVGVKLHLHNALEPHRAKIRQFLDRHALAVAARSANPAANPGNPIPMSMLLAERPAIQICRALLDPIEFADRVRESFNISAAELTPEERMAQSRDVTIFLRLFPSEINQLSSESLALSDDVLVSLGMRSPREAIETAKRGRLAPDMLRTVSMSALVSGHVDAAEIFRESNRLQLRMDSIRTRPSAAVANMLARQPDLKWYVAAKRASPELGQMAAWHLAYDYLNGKFEESGGNTILPTRERLTPQMLCVAYCTLEHYPELAHAIAQRAVPRLLKRTEQDFGQTFARNGDFSMAAWFDPQATCDMVVQLRKRIDDQQKKQVAGQRDFTINMQEGELSSLRVTCLRGLLLEEL